MSSQAERVRAASGAVWSPRDATRAEASSAARAAEPSELSHTQLPYLPGLDGLRAVAVIAVLLYHANPAWLPGGFLGVSVFFVLSGYLITSLLLVEWYRHGQIDLKAFWMRRARRLFPALYLLLLATLTSAVIFLPGEVARLRSDVIAAFGYGTNWYLVLDEQSYFEAFGRPSLLRHLWSLAIEEQFYLVWPLLLATGMARWRRQIPIVVLVAAIASTVLMATLYRPDIDPSRLYYGTDTRAAEFLIGAALAFFWEPTQLRNGTRVGTIAAPARQVGAGASLLLDVAGVTALGTLVWLFHRTNEFQSFLYRGGFAAIALTTAVLIAAVAHPRTRIASSLGWRPLRWVGQRSYSIYLWHWPVFMVTRPQLDVQLDGLSLLALRIVLTLVLAEASYRWVETPFRRGAVGRAIRAARVAPYEWGWRRTLWAAGIGGTAGTFVVALGVAVAAARPPSPPSYLATAAVHTTPPTPMPAMSIATPEPTPTPTLQPLTPTMSPAGDATPTVATPVPTPTPAPPPPTPTPDPQASLRVTAIGESVMIGAAQHLGEHIGNLSIDAQVARQAAASIDVLRARRDSGQLGDIVIVHIGNNGPVTAPQFDEMMQVLKGVPRVVVVNVKVPRPWEGPNNSVLAEGVQRYPNTVLVDWHAATAHRPELFWYDGVHLRPEGAKVYAELVATRVDIILKQLTAPRDLRTGPSP